jgi:hypothetical protein
MWLKGNFSGSESVMQGALETHILLILQVLKLFVSFSASIKKFYMECTCSNVDNLENTGVA